MVLIGNKPILWHIMKIYSSYGINEFVICLGYRGYVIRKFFDDSNYMNKETNNLKHYRAKEDWKVTLVNTGLDTMTGGRLKRVKKYVDNETFCFTYGDTLNNVNIPDLLDFHRKKKAIATVTACIPPEKYGILKMQGSKVINFSEKPVSEKNWVNGGYFVLEPEIFDFIKNDKSVWENEPMEKLARTGHFFAYKHTGFYQMMDTLREKNYLNELWKSGKAPWKVW